ncbi:Hsp70 family protein [Streptomyces sp. NPDC002018]|uniref:Hsp70 family protein n=1 Tax=Streptomyces sp. NPDC002018 TaxID=3364629 RepID=UPI0036C8C676
MGIDLWTTYCAVAVADRSGSPSIVRNREGENITPSVVMFQGDTVVVGSQAKRSAGHGSRLRGAVCQALHGGGRPHLPLGVRHAVPACGDRRSAARTP